MFHAFVGMSAVTRVAGTFPPGAAGVPGPRPAIHEVAHALAHLPGVCVSDEVSCTWIRTATAASAEQRIQVGGEPAGDPPRALRGRCRPILAWAGAKTFALPVLVQQVAQLGRVDVVGEPFAGGLAFTLGLFAAGLLSSETTVLIGDCNAALVAAYDAVREAPTEVWQAMQTWRVNERTYYHVRDDVEPTSEIQAAARFVWLNRCGYMGVHRTSTGKSNVPFGQKTSLAIGLAELEAFGEAIRSATLVTGDAGVILQQLADRARGSATALAYCDPPFWADPDVASAFTEYNGVRYGPQHHIELANRLSDCRAAGVHVQLSNAWTCQTTRLAEAAGLECRALWRRRKFGKHRLPVAEMLATSRWARVLPDHHIACDPADPASRAAAMRDLRRIAMDERLLTGQEAGFEHLRRAGRRPPPQQFAMLAAARGISLRIETDRIELDAQHEPVVVQVEPPAYRRGDHAVSLRSAYGLLPAVAAELTLAGALDAPPPTRFLGPLLAGSAELTERDALLVERIGLLDDAAPARWLREQVAHHLAEPGVGRLGSPAAVAGVVTAGGRCVTIDGVALRHTDGDALAEWLAWRHAQNVRSRGRPLTWRLERWGVVVEPGSEARALASGTQVSWQAAFDRHRRSADRRQIALNAAAPSRAQGVLRKHYRAVARLWLAGWSLAELALITAVHRSSVERLIRSARAIGSRALRVQFHHVQEVANG